MGKLIVSEFVSLDGVMQAPGGEPGYKHTGWVFLFPQDPEHGEFKFDEIMEADCQLLGRRTYEGFAEAWPGRDGEFADRMNAMPKFVVSSTLQSAAWNNTEVLSGDLAGAVTRLKETNETILVAGSRTLVHALHKLGLIDEYRLMMFPVILGSGDRVFPDDADDKLRLHLVECRAFTSGVVLQIYRPAPDATPAADGEEEIKRRLASMEQREE